MNITPNFFRPGTAAALALSLMASAAHAELIITDWKTVGDQAVMWDTVGNRDWLRLENTTGLSFNTVSAQLGSGSAFSGFTYALTADLWALYANAGLTPSYPAPDAEAKWFVGSYGGEQSSGNYVYNLAISASLSPYEADHLLVGMVAYGSLTDPSYANANGSVILPSVGDAGIGSALWRVHQDVSVVPEPGSAALVLAGLLGLAMLRRQC